MKRTIVLDLSVVLALAAAGPVGMAFCVFPANPQKNMAT